MLTIRNKSNFFFLLAFHILSSVTLMLLLPALGFFFGITVSKFYLPLAIGLACFFTWFPLKNYYQEGSMRIAFQLFLSLVIIFGLSFAIAFIFYDVSFDGQTYHQEGIIQLKNGWNPFFEDVPQNPSLLWINHYCKGGETPASVIYAFFNKIEIGKATNILLIFASFFICLSALFKLNITSNIKSILLAGVFTANTVTLTQALTYYFDGQLASVLLCLLSLSLLFVLEADRYKLLLLSFCNIILLNIKFTSIAFVGIIILTILILLYFMKRRNDMIKVFVAAIISSLIAVLFIGFNPYITNTLKNGHPFYPLAGKGKVDIMTPNCPEHLIQKNRFEKFLITTYSKTEDINGKDDPQLKIPFFFENRELEVKYATRIGGFGFWFSGIFTLAGILLIILFLYYFNSDKMLLGYFAIVITMFFVSIFIIPEPWWARYIPQVWFYPLVVILMAERTNDRKIRLLSNAVLLCAIVNVITVGGYTALFNYARTKEVKQQILTLQGQNQSPVRVDFGVFEPNRIRFEEHHIPYVIETFKKDDSLAVEVIYSHARFKL